MFEPIWPYEYRHDAYDSKLQLEVYAKLHGLKFSVAQWKSIKVIDLTPVLNVSH